MPWPRRSAPTCSTSTPIPTTIAAPTRWPARRASWPGLWSTGPPPPWSDCQSPGTRASTRTWAWSTWRRSSTWDPRTGEPPVPKRWSSPTGSAQSSTCRCSCTGCWAAAAAAPSCAAVGRRRCARRIEAGELTPDFGPASVHPSAGATLVAARPPLVAFNLELAPPATLDDARAIAAPDPRGGRARAARRAGDRPVARAPRPGSGLDQRRGPRSPRRWPTSWPRSPGDAPLAGAELVGLAPRHAFDGFPAELPLTGYATIEDTLAQRARTA